MSEPLGSLCVELKLDKPCAVWCFAATNERDACDGE